MSVTLKIAYELVQVRNGPNIIGKPVARGGTVVGTREAVIDEMCSTWSLMRGEDGAEKRRLTMQMRLKMKASWEHGEARKAMEQFAQYL